MKSFVLAATLAAFALPVQAQEAVTSMPTPVAPAVTMLPPAGPAMLRAGTAISLKLLEEVTTKNKAARVGQRINLEVAAPVEVNGVTVIPAGAPAWGEITNVKNKGMWGKSGKLNAQLLFLRVNGRQIRLSGGFDDKGTAGTAGVVGSVVLLPLAGFFVTGTSAKLPKGGAVNGFIDEDVALSFSEAASAPMAVPATTPLAVPAQ